MLSPSRAIVSGLSGDVLRSPSGDAILPLQFLDIIYAFQRSFILLNIHILNLYSYIRK